MLKVSLVDFGGSEDFFLEIDMYVFDEGVLDRKELIFCVFKICIEFVEFVKFNLLDKSV